MNKRRKTRKIKVGNIYIGGNAPVVVQSMTKTDTRDVAKTVEQILKLEEAGCQLIRCAVPDMKAAKALGKIKRKIHIPLAADIHFDYKLALEAVEQGVDKLRLNPGNITDKDKIKLIAKACRKNKVPIRVGVNSGSLKKEILKKYKGHVTAQGVVESAMEEIRILEKEGLKDIIVSLKISDVGKTVEAYKLLGKKCSYPFHIGITEAGPLFSGSIKSSVGIGILLYEGLGDTLRVSLTDDPVYEVKAGYKILQSLGLSKKYPNIISCPTCGRCTVNIKRIVEKIEDKFSGRELSATIAVMGCVVNGPGEAREADFGVACGKREGVIFKKGKIIKTVKEKEIVNELARLL
ncbi:MAG: flavodoxin-dependent (E)-4-hydroxy-3-methylbut-2-enyl-diphosphate synthase [Armatimonadota bacterium]